jgi:hypothetical protein
MLRNPHPTRLVCPMTWLKPFGSGVGDVLAQADHDGGPPGLDGGGQAGGLGMSALAAA